MIGYYSTDPNSSVSGKLQHVLVVVLDFARVERPHANDNVDIVAIGRAAVAIFVAARAGGGT